jgi:mannosyltransferase OCH1-like enzyme
VIPRIIHQTYPGGALAPELQRNVDRLKILNPGWEHRLYDDDQANALVSEYGGEICEAYHRIDARYGAARADLLRHLMLFRFGGVYCDIKSGFSRPLDDVIRPDDTYILAQWRNGPGEANEGAGLHRDLSHVPGGEFVNYFIICEPGHAFSAAAIQKIVKNIFSYRPWSAVGRAGVLRTTGPIAYTRAIYPILDQHPHRLASEEELSAYFSPDDYDHYSVFKNHYSMLSAPVVKLGPLGETLSRLCVRYRGLKARITGVECGGRFSVSAELRDLPPLRFEVTATDRIHAERIARDRLNAHDLQRLVKLEARRAF